MSSNNNAGSASNNNAASSDFANFFSSQYDRQQFKNEFQTKSKELWNSMSFFVRWVPLTLININSVIVVSKVSLYLSSWVTSSLNDIFSLNSTLTFFSLNSKTKTNIIYIYIVWRFLTAPLATSSLFDVLLIMSFYLVKTLGPREHLKGTALAMVEFFVKGIIMAFIYI
jgi:hypothetical protein